jgi:hypothetical protein
MANEALTFTWPTLAGLNDKLFLEFEAVGEDDMDDSSNLSSLILGLYTGPPPPTPTCSIPEIPSANTLAQRIISSTDKLFFISWRIGGSTNNICKWWLIGVALAPIHLVSKTANMSLTSTSSIHLTSDSM